MLETVAARLTPLSAQALATIGVRGRRANEVVQRLFRKKLPQQLDRFAYGDFGGEVQDDVVVRVVANSIVSEAEIHCHGGVAMVDALLLELAKQGVRIVDWREYLRLQGMSEIQVEAAEAMSRCPTARCAAILLDQYLGALDRAMQKLDGATADSLLRWSKLGLRLVEPWRVLLFGQANVGKSSLLNALVGFERAIVAPTPGTTRDLVHGQTAIDGWPIEFIDGAGFRDDPTGLERAGIELLKEAAKSADVKVLVVDLSEAPSAMVERLKIELSPDLVVGNKADLPIAWSGKELTTINWKCSATAPQGIAELANGIAQLLVVECPEPGTPVPFTRRQVDEIKRWRQ